MSQGTNNAVATTGVAALPAFMQQDANTGKENIARDDMVIPRVALMQAVNPEVLEAKATNGNFYHTVSEEDLGEELDIIIVHHSKRYTLWNPRHSGGGVLARASDGQRWDDDWEGEVQVYKDQPKKKIRYSIKKGETIGRDVGLGKWGTTDPENPDSPPAATLTHVLVCICPDRVEMGPFVILLQRSAEPVAKMLLSKVSIDPAPIYGQIYSVSSKVVNSSAGDGFNQYVFTKNGHVQDADLYEALKTQNSVFTEAGVKIDEAAAQGEDPADSSAGADSGDAKY